jgi:hypothetical protein
MKNKHMIKDYKVESMIIKVNEDFDGKLVIYFEGQANIKDEHDINEMGGFLVRLHNEIISAGIKEVILNFEYLKMLNSECLKTLKQWFNLINNSDDHNKYKINLIYNQVEGETGNYIDIIKNMYPTIIELSRPSIMVIHHFDLKKDSVIKGENWFTYYPSEAIMFTDKIKMYIIEKFEDKLPPKLMKTISEVFKNLPKDTEIIMEKHRVRNSPVQEFFNTLLGSYIKLYPDTHIEDFVSLPSMLTENEYLKKLIKSEYHSSKRRALTSLLNNKSINFNGKLILDSLNIDFNVNFTEPIITTLKKGLLCISRREPAFNFGNIILFVYAGDWCSIKDCRITNGIMSFSPNVVVNCEGIVVKEKLTIITYKKCKSLYINLDKELEKSGKINFQYLDDDNTKNFLKTNGWPIYPEPPEDEILNAYRKQKENAEQYEIIKFENENKPIKKTSDDKDWEYVSIPGDTYGRLVKIYKEENKGEAPDYTKVMKLYETFLKKFGTIKDDNYSYFNQFLDNIITTRKSAI